MFPYLKSGRDIAKLSNRARYIATRPGVEVLRGEHGDQPAICKQQANIRCLLCDFPGADELLEYEDYSTRIGSFMRHNPGQHPASVCQNGR